MTIATHLIAGLQRLGWEIDPNPRTGKYLVMRPANATWPNNFSAKARFFIGRAGALRYHPDGIVNRSVPWERAKRIVLRDAQ